MNAFIFTMPFLLFVNILIILVCEYFLVLYTFHLSIFFFYIYKDVFGR